ncbi:iron-containing alcohol dehydrogenase [Pirellulaceae bacterium SH449]
MNAYPFWKFSAAGTIYFGRGSLTKLSEEIDRRQLKTLAVVTDSIVANIDLVQHAIATLQARGVKVAVFDGGEAEPSIEIAKKATVKAREIDADGVIGIGGGSNMDVAKVVAILLKHGGKPADYFGFDKVPGPISPLIAIPTTSGTGSEVSHSAVLTDTVAQIKVSTLSPYLRPSVAIVDSRLTDSCPPRVTAHSGIDALVHAIEAMTNRPFTELSNDTPRAYEGSYRFTELLAGEAIKLIAQNLEQAVRTPNDAAARDAMAYAAMLAGMAFSNSGVGLVHALEYPIGAITHCSHGEGNGLLLPYVMEYNRYECDIALRKIAHLMTGNPYESCSVEGAILAVRALQSSIGIRTKLGELGLLEEHIPTVATKAIQIERLMSITARRPTEADLIAILKNAI